MADDPFDFEDFFEGLRPNSLVNLLSSPRRREPNSDDFLNELVSRDFSSPSIPSRSPRRAAQLDNSLAASNLPLLSRNTSTLLPSLAHSLSQQRVKGETPPPPDGEEPPLSLSPADSLFVSPGMSSTRPPSKRGTGSEGVALASSSRRPASPFDQLDSRGQRLPPILNITSSPQEPARKRKRDDVAEPEILKVKRNADDDNFGVDDGIKIVDLVDAVKVPAFVMDKKPKNEVKLGAFQCVICMDDVKDLTVTHCGHLFCSECLHSSLNIDVSKKICPICRQKIDSRPPNDGNFTQKAKGYYALELKLITRKSLGKRNARI
ncbi:hypothetical protein B0T24DRAFT_168680 [Lasiosphaeria ovina]|uniref:RING-type domain-containing protein n=1 Tax=Lasiosphaeria ovina TaxID=92902 RepID=A0AAE0NE03_9PEZI|nr:hypothetical protein B0T24DRAFT_168680 [Lasiosphaeria ovina]